MATTVLLVDAVSELRVAVRQALGATGVFEVVAEAADGTEAIALAGTHQPDMVVLELGIPDLAGHEVLTGLYEAAPLTRVVVFGGAKVPDREVVAMRADALVPTSQRADDFAAQLVVIAEQPRFSAVARLSDEPFEAGAARQFIEDRCHEWGCERVVPHAQLVVSELVTNAIIHAHSGCKLRVAMMGDALRLEVTDGGGGVPELMSPSVTDLHGRGLLIVDAFSRAWGVVPRHDGRKTVWAVLPV